MNVLFRPDILFFIIVSFLFLWAVKNPYRIAKYMDDVERKIEELEELEKRSHGEQ